MFEMSKCHFFFLLCLLNVVVSFFLLSLGLLSRLFLTNDAGSHPLEMLRLQTVWNPPDAPQGFLGADMRFDAMWTRLGMGSTLCRYLFLRTVVGIFMPCVEPMLNKPPSKKKTV